jgi:hypothetical protein
VDGEGPLEISDNNGSGLRSGNVVDFLMSSYSIDFID